MVGTVLNVNISPGGLPKRPVVEAHIGPLGIEGDAVAHPTIHGGPQQAILILTADSLEVLKSLGFELYPGALGENLTVEGLDRRKIRPGQRYRAGDAILEITRLRQPCKTIGVYGPGIQQAVFDQKAKGGDPTSEKWGLAGFYAAVIQPGRVSQNAPIMLLGQSA